MLDFVQPQIPVLSMVVGRDKHVELEWRGPSEKQRGGGSREARPLHPFPLPRCPHTRKELLTNRYPNTLCNICFSPSIWNGFVSIGRPR